MRMLQSEIATLVISIGLVLVVGVGAFYISKVACIEKTVSFPESKFTMLGGCMVKHKNRWLPLDNIRGFDDKG